MELGRRIGCAGKMAEACALPTLIVIAAGLVDKTGSVLTSPGRVQVSGLVLRVNVDTTRRMSLDESEASYSRFDLG